MGKCKTTLETSQFKGAENISTELVTTLPTFYVILFSRQHHQDELKRPSKKELTESRQKSHPVSKSRPTVPKTTACKPKTAE